MRTIDRTEAPGLPLRGVVEICVALSFIDVEVSYKVEQKIIGVHHVTPDDVADVLAQPHVAKWSANEEGTERLLVAGASESGRRIVVVLYPIELDRGEWRLATAYPDPRH